MKTVTIALLSAMLFAGCANGQETNGQKDSGIEKPEPPAAVEPATSAALPAGMKLVWNDEFNGTELDRTKWSSDYYSTVDYLYKTNWDDFQAGTLPQPAMRFTGSSIVLYTSPTEPARDYWPSTGRKISSIQTYDWLKDKNNMEPLVGGYIEARIRRTAAADATMVNGAFWLDSPGPDLRYWMEQGNTAKGATGLRPHGQVFEVDLCENLSTEIVLHGNVDANGDFQGNMGHFILEGNPHSKDKWIVHGMLWTAAGMRFYIDGEQRAESWNAGDIKSPNHWMNLFLGMYGKGDTSMEVDYIRFYQWDNTGAGDMHNGGFEYSDNTIFPWEGDGVLDSANKRTGANGLCLPAGCKVVQYVYLDHSSDYTLEFWAKSDGSLTVSAENITQVTVAVASEDKASVHAAADFSKHELAFTTAAEPADHKRTVRITFENRGSENAYIDDVKLIVENEKI